MTVYCRSDYPSSMPKAYEGVRLVHLPRLRKSFGETPFNTLIAAAHASMSSYDVMHFFGGGSVPFLIIPRLFGRRIVVTVDGLEWKRLSYSLAARAYLRAVAELTLIVSNVTVADSHSSMNWYHKRTGNKPEYIPYGASISSETDDNILEKYSLEPRRYIVFIGRLVYEKGVHTIVEAFKSVNGDVKLVIIGDSPEETSYVRELKDSADQRTVFLGYVYGRELDVIRNASMIYVHPSLLDGTSISLLSALAAGKCIVSSNLPENMDVAGDAATYFSMEDPRDLAGKMNSLIGNIGRIRELEDKAIRRACDMFDWDTITESYENLYRRIAGMNEAER